MSADQRNPNRNGATELPEADMAALPQVTSDEASTPSGRFLMRPVGDDVSTWSDGPPTLSLPAGTRIDFRLELPTDHYVIWRGAREQAMTLHSSTACAELLAAGRHDVEVKAYDPESRLIYRAITRIEVGPAEELRSSDAA